MDRTGNGTEKVDKTDRLRSLKITVVGDGTVGKTCLLISYTQNAFPEQYVPTVFDNHAKSIVVDGVSFSLTLWDTAGQEEYEKLRPLSYPKTDCFLLCYAIDNPSSFANIELKWIPELKGHCPKATIILVGTKSDLNYCDESTVCEQEGKKLMKKIKANGFILCSAKTRDKLEDVFQLAVRSVMKNNTGRRRFCNFL